MKAERKICPLAYRHINRIVHPLHQWPLKRQSRYCQAKQIARRKEWGEESQLLFLMVDKQSIPLVGTLRWIAERLGFCWRRRRRRVKLFAHLTRSGWARVRRNRRAAGQLATLRPEHGDWAYRTAGLQGRDADMMGHTACSATGTRLSLLRLLPIRRGACRTDGKTLFADGTESLPKPAKHPDVADLYRGICLADLAIVRKTADRAPGVDFRFATQKRFSAFTACAKRVAQRLKAIALIWETSKTHPRQGGPKDGTVMHRQTAYWRNAAQTHGTVSGDLQRALGPCHG